MVDDAISLPACQRRTCPPLGLLAFEDARPRAKSDEPAKWASAKPPSYQEWFYRESPWRSDNKAEGPTHRRGLEVTSARGCLESPGLKFRTPRLPSSSASTRAPSRATQASPETRAASTATPGPEAQGPWHGRGGSRARTPQCGQAYSPCLPRSPAPGPLWETLEICALLKAVVQDGSLSGGPSSCSVVPDPAGLESPLRSEGASQDMFSTTSDVSAHYAAIAELAGSRARGPVTLAIRAKAACRLAASAASRRLHLHSAGDGVSSSTWGGYGDGRSPSVSRDARSGTDAGKASQRCIRVAQNTTLGQMVKRDPERAAKYNLVAVPAWQQNKSWPPPPVAVQRRVPGAMDVSKKASWHPSEQTLLSKDCEDHSRPQKGWGPLKPFGLLLGQWKAKQRAVKKEGTRCVQTEAAARQLPAVNVDLRAAQRLLSPEDVCALTDIFTRYSMGSGGCLTRKGIQLAMKASGIAAPADYGEQFKLKRVQEEVLNHFRCSGDCKVPNPLTDATGAWELREFLLMMAAIYELDQQEASVSNQMLAKHLDLDPGLVEALYEVFKTHAVPGSSTISVADLQKILATLDVRPSVEELKLLLGNAALESELSFQDFVRCMGTVGDFLKPSIKSQIPSPLSTLPGSATSDAPSSAPSSPQ